MIQAANLSASAMRKSIITYAIFNALVYIIFALSFKYLNMLHIWGLYMINFVVLTLISLLQVHRWIRQGGGYVPFLQTFFTILFTGSCSFILFAAFVLIYTLFDPFFAKLFITHTNSTGIVIAPILLFFEGTGGSIIVGLIASFYAASYEDGETPMPGKHRE